MNSMKPTILMPASLAHQIATEVVDKTHQYDEAIAVLAQRIDDAVRKGLKEVQISCLELDFSDKVQSMWMNELVKEGYEIEILDARTQCVHISWETPNKPIKR